MPRKKNSLYRQVRRAYRQEELARICTLPEAEFGRAFGMQTVSVPQRRPHDYYHFRDNGARVLAVAHLDTVVRDEHRTPQFRTTPYGPLVVSGALDDRLGAYVILHLLPELGVTCDWLLTVGEESARSTAGFFTPGKKYDWVIEFDRGGTDVVMYQYEDDASRDAVEACGAVVGAGSFSDICALEHLGVKAFNWGVGYGGDYHSQYGYALLRDTFAMVAQYLRFHAQNSGTAMPHEQKWAWFDTSKDGKYDDDAAWECVVCYEFGKVDLDTDICAACDSCQGCYMSRVACQCYTGLEQAG